jgi:hypothetical protein
MSSYTARFDAISLETTEWHNRKKRLRNAEIFGLDKVEDKMDINTGNSLMTCIAKKILH